MKVENKFFFCNKNKHGIDPGRNFAQYFLLSYPPAEKFYDYYMQDILCSPNFTACHLQEDKREPPNPLESISLQQVDPTRLS